MGSQGWERLRDFEKNDVASALLSISAKGVVCGLYVIVVSGQSTLWKVHTPYSHFGCLWQPWQVLPTVSLFVRKLKKYICIYHFWPWERISHGPISLKIVVVGDLQATL